MYLNKYKFNTPFCSKFSPLSYIEAILDDFACRRRYSAASKHHLSTYMPDIVC